MNWEKTGRTVKSDGTTINRYESGKYAIESMKRMIPHSGRPGYWMHTSYFLICPDGYEKEFFSLRDAKEAAEGLAKGRK